MPSVRPVYWIQQFISQAPMLGVYLLGMLLSLIFIQQGMPALLCLVACGILLVTSVAQTVLQGTLIQQRESSGMTAEQLGQQLSRLAMSGGLMRALAMIALIAAVFIGRQAGNGGAASAATTMPSASSAPSVPR